MSGGVRLEASGLTRYFGSNPALDNVSFTVEPGEFLVVLGPNGAGKTTLLKILARLMRPTKGGVTVDGADWLAAPPGRQVDVGMVSHATYVYDGLSAIENLRFFGTLYGIDDVDRRGRVALAEVGLEALADRRAGTFSRGQAQRLAIARAVLHEPRLLLFDEPFAGLDPHAAGRLTSSLTEQNAAGRTIILTTHDLDRAPDAATQYMVIVNGSIRAAGARAELPEQALRVAYERAVARQDVVVPESGEE